MKQIYTKTGDLGQTNLRGGFRVNKDDPRIEANGQLDMLNSMLGLVRVLRPKETLLADVQRCLMTVMSHVATPDGEQNPRPLNCQELTLRMETAIDAASVPTGFIVPGDSGNESEAFIHIARSQCRTAERRLWSLNRQHPVSPDVMTMLNRLSDYLFILATNKS